MWIAVGCVGLIGSVALVWLTTPAEAGSVVLAPWVALLAVELGILRGVVVGFVATLAYLARGLVGSAGEHVTWLLVGSSLLPLIATGVAAALVAARIRSNASAYRSLVEGVPLGMYVTSPNRSEVRYVSAQFEQITGRTLAELNDPLVRSTLTHADNRDELADQAASSRDAAAPHALDHRLVRPDGTTVWVRDISVVTGEGATASRTGFVYDVTPDLRAAEGRRRDAHLMQSLLDGAVDAMCLTDRDGRILLENAPIRRVAFDLGLPREGLIQDRLLSIAHRFTQPDEYRRGIKQVATTPDDPSFHEFEFRDSGRSFQGFTSPVVASDGAYLGRIWTLREVTEARRLERAQQTLFATISHELRTPLTSILGYLELLPDVLPSLEERPARYLEVIARNAVRLRALIDGLLLVAQVDAERLDLELSDVDLAEIAARSHEAAVPAAKERGVALRLSIDARPTVVGDAARLAQAIDNVVSNAIKFTPEGGTVDIRVEETENAAIVTVVDTGIGIPADEQEQIGNRFFRSSTATSAGVGGSGLGMAIVKMIVHAHEGHVGLESALGRGTTVTLELPREPGER